MNLPATTAEYEAKKYMITAPKGAKMSAKDTNVLIKDRR